MPLPGLMTGELPPQWEARRATLSKINDVECFPVPSPEAFGVTDPDDIAWVARRLTPFPAHLIAARIELEHRLGNGIHSTYVFSSANKGNSGLMLAAENYAREHFESFVDLPTGHDSMVTMPAELAAIIGKNP
jgi:hypothetical protein